MGKLNMTSEELKALHDRQSQSDDEKIDPTINPELIEWAAKISTTDCTKVHAMEIMKWVQSIYALGHKAGFIEGYAK